MNVYDLELNMPHLLEEVCEITNHDKRGIEDIVLEDGKKYKTPKNNKLIALSKEFKKELGFYDKINPMFWIKKASSYIGRKVTPHLRLMSTNGKTIWVFCDGEKPDVLNSLLVHELTHVVDSHYHDFFGKQNKLYEEAIGLAKQALKAKHDEGFIGGYVRKTEKVSSLEAQTKAKIDEMNNLIAIVESHAEYVGNEWVKKHKIIPISGKMLLKALVSLPSLLIPSTWRKNKQYSAARKLITAVYNHGIPMETLYNNVPSQDDFKNPHDYLQRVFYNGKPIV